MLCNILISKQSVIHIDRELGKHLLEKFDYDVMKSINYFYQQPDIINAELTKPIKQDK